MPNIDYLSRFPAGFLATIKRAFVSQVYTSSTNISPGRGCVLSCPELVASCALAQERSVSCLLLGRFSCIVEYWVERKTVRGKGRRNIYEILHDPQTEGCFVCVNACLERAILLSRRTRESSALLTCILAR